MCTSLCRPSSLSKKGEDLGGKAIQNMDAIVEMGHCIHGVVVFNGSLYSRVYGQSLVHNTCMMLATQASRVS